jgi:hypothetical protein
MQLSSTVIGTGLAQRMMIFHGCTSQNQADLLFSFQRSRKQSTRIVKAGEVTAQDFLS